MRDDNEAGVRLTRDGVHPSAHDDLIPSGAGAQGLVAHTDEDDGEEAEDEAGSGPDVPRLEDDAQVCRVPSEKHLGRANREVSTDVASAMGWMARAEGRASTYVHAAHGGHIVALVAAMAGHGHVHVAVAVRHIPRVVGVGGCRELAARAWDNGSGAGDGQDCEGRTVAAGLLI